MATNGLLYFKYLDDLIFACVSCIFNSHFSDKNIFGKLIKHKLN